MLDRFQRGDVPIAAEIGAFDFVDRGFLAHFLENRMPTILKVNIGFGYIPAMGCLIDFIGKRIALKYRGSCHFARLLSNENVPLLTEMSIQFRTATYYLRRQIYP